MGAGECQFRVTDLLGTSWRVWCCYTETTTPLAITVRPAVTVSEKS